MLLVFFLCVGMIISSILNDTTSILLGLVLIIALLRYETFKVILVAAINLLSHFGLRLQKPGFHPRFLERDVWYDPFYRNFCRLSPIESYLKLSERTFHLQCDSISSIYDASPVTPFQELLGANLDLLAVQIIFTFAAVAACYYISTRRELG
jgi:hypothetical protein